MARSSSAHIDIVALETARAVLKIAAWDCPGGDCQRLAAIQVAIVEAIRRCSRDPSHLTEIQPDRFTRPC